MEASGLGGGPAAAPETGGEAEAAAEGAPAEGTAGLDLGPLSQRFDQMEERIGPMLERIEQGLPAPEGGEPEAGAEEGDPFAGVDLDALFGADGQPDPAAAEQVLQSMQAATQAAVGPLAAEVAQMRADRQAEVLTTQYPELNDQATLDWVARDAAERAHSMGDPNLARNPGIIELVYLAGKAQRTAAQETPAGTEGAAALEGGGGAAPAPTSEDRGQAIVDAGRRAGSVFQV